MKLLWLKHNVHQELTKICCPTVDAIKVKFYLQCINNNCKRKMLRKGCKLQINVALTFADDVSNNQHNVTAFSYVLYGFEDFSERDEVYIENIILDLQKYDFCKALTVV